MIGCHCPSHFLAYFRYPSKLLTRPKYGWRVLCDYVCGENKRTSVRARVRRDGVSQGFWVLLAVVLECIRNHNTFCNQMFGEKVILNKLFANVFVLGKRLFLGQNSCNVYQVL